MDGPRDQILAGSGLAADEDRDIRPRRLSDDLPHLPHLGALPEGELLLEASAPVVLRLVPPGARRTGDGALDGVFEVFRGEGLLEDVFGPEGGDLGYPLDAAAVGNDDDWTRTAPLDLEAPQELGSVGAVELEVHQAQQEPVVAERGQRLAH